MNKCPSCGMPLKDGQEFCPPTKTMTKATRGNPSHVKFIFLGCAMLDFSNLDLTTHARHAPGDYRAQVTDHQRALEIWGTGCIISEYGPLPSKSGTHDEGVRGRKSAWAE